MHKYISETLVSKLVKLIIYENKKGLSYDKIAKLVNSPYIKPGTICRIAKSNGEWLPKSEKILMALGVIVFKVRKYRISDMPSKELLWRLEHREVMK